MALPVNNVLKIISNLYIRQSIFQNVGDENAGWVSSFDRMMLLTSGSVKILSNNETIDRDFEAPMLINLAKNMTHRIIAKEANTVAYHIHAIRNGQTLEDIVDPDLPNEELTQLAIDWPITNSPGAPKPVIIEPEN